MIITGWRRFGPKPEINRSEGGFARAAYIAWITRVPHHTAVLPIKFIRTPCNGNELYGYCVQPPAVGTHSTSERRVVKTKLMRLGFKSLNAYKHCAKRARQRSFKSVGELR